MHDFVFVRVGTCGLKAPIFYRRFDYDRRLLPNAHLRALEDGVSDIAGAEQQSGATVGYPGWGLIYQMMLNSMGWEAPSIIVETGTNWGCSTIILAQALKDSVKGGRVHTIEIDPHNCIRAAQNIEAAGLSEFVSLYEGNSLAILPGVLDGVDEVHAAFLDGCHLHDQVVAEFELVVRRLSPRGLVIFDNIYGLFEGEEDERVFGALNTIKARYGGNIVQFDHTSWYTPGLAVWQR